MNYGRFFHAPRFTIRHHFGELERMRRQMDRLFDALPASADCERCGVYPPANLTEDAHHYYLRSELPGVREQDLDIQADGKSVSIAGQRKIESAGDAAKYHRREREAGKFSRILSLPGEIEPEKVSAGLADGLLTITMPKAEKTRPRRIAIGG